MLEPICDHPGCTRPEYGNHYHCGQCESPEPTSMLGHYLFGQFTCDMTKEEKSAFVMKKMGLG